MGCQPDPTEPRSQPSAFLVTVFLSREFSCSESCQCFSRITAEDWPAFPFLCQKGCPSPRCGVLWAALAVIKEQPFVLPQSFCVLPEGTNFLSSPHTSSAPIAEHFRTAQRGTWSTFPQLHRAAVQREEFERNTPSPLALLSLPQLEVAGDHLAPCQQDLLVIASPRGKK